MTTRRGTHGTAYEACIRRAAAKENRQVILHRDPETLGAVRVDVTVSGVEQLFTAPKLWTRRQPK